MKTLLNAALFLLLAATANAQRYIPQDENSKVGFSVVNHMVIKMTVDGTLKDLKGTITFDPADLKDAAFDVSVKVATINTGIGKRDEHLKKEEFFDADRFPAIHITSSKIEKGSSPGTYILYGKLTMKGISKDVVISFSTAPANGGLLFTGSFDINRLDYTVGSKGNIEEWVKVNLAVFAKKA